MIPIPKSLNTIAQQLPRAKPKPRLTQEEKIQMIKQKFGLSHGKGKTKFKNKKKGK